jgi:MtrB/PioB family decaheme-associated outer membrane protein
MRTRVVAAAMLTGVLALTTRGAAVAQDTTSGTASASLELGARRFAPGLPGPQLGKFGEYKDLPSGAVLQQFAARFTPGWNNTEFQVVGRRIGALDQSVWVRGFRPGLFDLQVRSDRIPHTFSTTARALGYEAGPGIYVLPSVRNDTAALNRSDYLSPIRTMWDPVRVSLAVTPNTRWDMKAEYTRVAKTGGRPMGMAFGSPGNNAREIVEPVDQTTHEIRLSQSYARDRFQIAGTYDVSLFKNNLSSVTSDNPLRATDTTNMSSRGRIALAPSNIARTAIAMGALNLPFRTRVSSTFAYSWWRQDEPLIRATINSAITDPRIAAIPASLGGEVQTSNVSASLSSRPWSPVNLTAHFRSYAYRDHATNDVVPLLVVDDRSISPADSGERNPFRKTNADVGLSWRLPVPVTIGGTYAWDQMRLDSALRNVSRYTEHTPRVTLDFTGLSWATVRASYSKSWRRTPEYHQTETGVMPEFQRFDVSDRDRERLDLSTAITPIDALTLGAMWQVGHDEYPSAAYGTQNNEETAVGGDASLSISRRLIVSAGYTYERFRNVQWNRYRTGTQLTNLTYDWFARNTDRTRTASASATVSVVPNRLEAGATFEWSHTRFIMAAGNFVQPTGGTTAQNGSATAVDYPTISQTLQPMSTYLRYRLAEEWTVIVRFEGELFAQNDFRTLGLNPATGNFIFLGNNFMNYNARFLTMSLSYRPWPIRLGRSTI